MTCHNCHTTCNRFGKHRNGLQRYRCSQCRKTFAEEHAQPFGDMRLPMDKAANIIKLMVEGMSVRSIERISLRMMSRRFTRLTNAFSKKLEYLKVAIALYFGYCNFCRVHQTSKQTPCMAARIADHVWTL